MKTNGMRGISLTDFYMYVTVVIWQIAQWQSVFLFIIFLFWGSIMETICLDMLENFGFPQLEEKFSQHSALLSLF
jgi:hypothetical protein